VTTGILLTNLGTPDSPSTAAVRKYLTEFLSDPRVIEIPKLFWLPILYGIILPFRAPRSAKLYQKIWTEKGSSLRFILEEQVQKLQIYLNAGQNNSKIIIIGAMRYGHPSIETGLKRLVEKNIKKLILFPLYPQYSGATTATTFDEVARVFKSLRVQPELHVINAYYQHTVYISAVAESIESHWKREGQTQKLLFSFHGLPEVFVKKGDPYYMHCLETGRLISEQLKLNADQWMITFQSRLGKAEWLKPYTDKVLAQLPLENIRKITVVCPGFSADCLETLEEVNMTNRTLFLQSGGEIFQYVPALNASDPHIKLFANLIEAYL
jgi:ferrochelatase